MQDHFKKDFTKPSSNPSEIMVLIHEVHAHTNTYTYTPTDHRNTGHKD